MNRAGAGGEFVKTEQQWVLTPLWVGRFKTLLQANGIRIHCFYVEINLMEEENKIELYTDSHPWWGKQIL